MRFRKSKQKSADIAEAERLEKAVSIEMKNHQNATNETIKKTQKVVDEFNRVIRENGFTLKIHVAAGGKK